MEGVDQLGWKDKQVVCLESGISEVKISKTEVLTFEVGSWNRVEVTDDRKSNQWKAKVLDYVFHGF